MTRDKIKLLVQADQIQDCHIVYVLNGWRIQLTPRSLAYAEEGGLILLDAARGGVRSFKSLDAAIEAVNDLGIRYCRVLTEKRLL